MSEPLFDYAAAIASRDEALDQVEAHSPPTATEQFEDAVKTVAARGDVFTTDDVLQLAPELEDVPEKRVFGAVMLRLARAGLIRAQGYMDSNRRTSHARPKRAWILNTESLEQ